MKKGMLSFMFAGGVLLVGGCGGTGKLSLQLTDAPPDLDAMSTAIVTIARVEAHVASDDDKDDDSDGKGWAVVTDVPREFDLLTLQNDVTAPLGDVELPPGKVTQIRMFLDTGARNEITLRTGEVCPLDTRNVDHGGVKINHPFKALQIEEGETVQATLDFDLKESVEKDGHCRYRLNPVIKLKAVKDDA